MLSEIKVFFSSVRNKTRLSMNITKRKIPNNVLFRLFFLQKGAELTSMVSSFNFQKPRFTYTKKHCEMSLIGKILVL